MPRRQPQRPSDPHGLLRFYRPLRYDHEDRTWMGAAIDAMTEEILAAPDHEEAIRRLARDDAERRVRGMEQQDVRLVHTFLRRVGKTGQWPLSMSFEDDVQVSPLRIGMNAKTTIKVRFAVCQRADLVAWELERRRGHDAATQVMLWETSGARTIVGWMEEQDVELIRDLDKGAVPGNSDEGPDEPLPEPDA